MASSVATHHRNAVDFDVTGSAVLPDSALQALASLLLDAMDADRVTDDRVKEDDHV